jgi:hypothetical protein
MMANVLMIGLGGTGIKTLVQIKQQLKGRNRDGIIPDNIQILGIDTLVESETVQGVYDPTALEDQDQLIELSPAEFVNQAGSLVAFLRQNRENHLDWMDTSWYLNHSSSATILNPQDGAGMHRQVGRLTLMAMLQNATNSPLYQKLSQKIAALNRPNATQFYLLVFGSLAGGTGASMVGDIPYLVKHISKQQGMTPSIFGFFALPDAFRHTGHVVVGESMRARALATLRELERFNLSNDEEFGYRMVYDAEGRISFRTKGSAYEILHLFDQRADYPLETGVAYGVCATMASFAWMFTDGGPGTELARHLANRSEHLGLLSAQFNGYNPPVCASYGTYSYVLPLGAMVESWTHRFAMEALKNLVPRDEETKRIRTNFVGGQLVRSGGRSVREVLTDELSARNNAFIQDLTEIGLAVAGRDASKESAAQLQKLSSRSVSGWIDIIRTPDPTPTQQAIFVDMLPENTYFCKLARGIFGEKIIIDDGAMVQLEDPKNYGNSSEAAAEELINNCEEESTKKYHLWRGNDEERIGTIYEVYSQWLLDKTEAVLNGSDAEDNLQQAIERKSGKLGWWWDFLQALVDGCNGLINTLKIQNATFSTQKERFITTAERDGIERTLRNDASKNNQKQYLKSQQEVFEVERKQMLLMAELDLVESIRDYTRALLKQTIGYINAIYSDSDVNIFGSMQASRNRIDQSRRDSGRFDLVREYIYDADWENTKYRDAVQPDNMGILPMSRVIDDLKWKVTEVTDNTDPKNSREVPLLTLEIGGFQRENHGYLRENKIGYYEEDLTEPEKNEISTAAMARLVARCRQVFIPVWNHISVLDYLVDKWSDADSHSPTGFAQQVSKKIGVVLNGLKDQPTAKTNLLYLHPSTNNVNHIQWMSNMYAELNQLMGVQQYQHSNLEHSDPTTFTVMQLMDFINYQKIDLWNAKENYLDQNPTLLQPPTLSRQILHVFNPEKEACKYDEDNRLLDAKIAGLFDNKESLDLFLEGLIWGFIKLKNLMPQGTIYVLELPPNYEEEDETGDRVTEPYVEYLNKPQEYVGGLIPPLLEAAQVFCLRENVYNEQDNNSTLQTKDDFEERLKEALQIAKDKEIENSLISWENKKEGLRADQLAVVQEPESNKKREQISQLVSLEKLRIWCDAAKGASKLDEIFNRFEEAREHDENNKLTIFADSENEFITVCLNNMIRARFDQIKRSIN